MCDFYSDCNLHPEIPQLWVSDTLKIQPAFKKRKRHLLHKHGVWSPAERLVMSKDDNIYQKHKKTLRVYWYIFKKKKKKKH